MRAGRLALIQLVNVAILLVEILGKLKEYKGVGRTQHSSDSSFNRTWKMEVYISPSYREYLALEKC